MVMVCHFKVWDQVRDKTIIQPLKSDANRIEQVGGSIVPGISEEVNVADLDADGRYNPKKSGQ
jgi:hypothetical protein